MDEETTIIRKSDTQEKPQSTLFNTSVRGWIALILSGTLSLTILLIVLGPFIDITVPDRVSDQLIALFSAGFGSAVTQYFQMKSREGQKVL